MSEIAKHAHLCLGELWNLRSRESWMLTAVADHIRAVYEQLAPQTPTGRYQAMVLRHAEAHGFVESWRWEGVDMDDEASVPLPLPSGGLDEVAVERFMSGRAGERPGASSASVPEVVEAIRRLAAAGMVDPEIGERLGLKRDTVRAIRVRNGIPSGLTVEAAA